MNGDGFLFLEGMGYGVFPRLMKKMRDHEGHDDETPEENLRIALDMLHDIILSYKAKACTIEAEGITYSVQVSAGGDHEHLLHRS